MATKIEEIWNEVVNILRNSPVLSAYVKEVVEGEREDLPVFPAIIVNPINETEINHTVPEYKRITFQIQIEPWIEVISFEKQIIGENGDKGILDMVRDIKNELEKYPDLNGKCIKFDFPNTTYTSGTYPYRGAVITMSIEFITQKTNR